MTSNELKSIIENARISKGISQRELAKISGISRSTLNDIINGKIKKVDVDSLKKIAEILDLPLERLLYVAGYNDFLRYFNNDKDETKSSKYLKKQIDEYKKLELALLDFDLKKRNKAKKLINKLDNMKIKFKLLNENVVTDYTLEQAMNELSEIRNVLREIAEKYDYSNLPKNI